jgi:O-antigen/teichoic acid export membrane protein
MKQNKEKSISYILIWQIGGKFLLQGIAFISVPIYTRLLTTADYGKVAVYSSWVSLCSLVVGLQTSGSIRNARIKYTPDKIQGYLSSIMTISLISFSCILLISIIFNKLLSNLLDLRSDLILLLIIQSFASFCISFYTSKLIHFKQVVFSSILSFIASLSSITLAIVLLFSIKENKYIVKIYGNALPLIVIGFVIFVYVLLKGRKFYNKQYWQYCLALTIPLILHSAGHLILTQSDRIILQRISGEGAVGIYSFAYTLGMIVSIIWDSFNGTWIPFYYDYKKNNQNDIILIRSKNYIITFSVIVMGFILLAPEVYKIASPQEYWTGIPLIPIIAFSYYLNFLYGFPVNFEFYNGKTKLIAIGTICSAFINILLNFVLIPLYAGIGAAIATVISYVFLFIFHEIIARFIIKNYEYPIHFYLLGIIPVTVTVVSFYFMQDQWLIRWGISFTMGCYLLRRIIKNKSIF